MVIDDCCRRNALTSVTLVPQYYKRAREEAATAREQNTELESTIDDLREQNADLASRLEAVENQLDPVAAD